jgi:hypothetical protein
VSEIKTTLGDLVAAEKALSALDRLKPPAITAKARYHIAKLTGLVLAETKLFHQHEREYITELGETLNPDAPEHEHQVRVTPAHWPEYMKRMEDLAAQPASIPWGPITDDMIGEADVSVGELRALGPLGPLAVTTKPEPNKEPAK